MEKWVNVKIEFIPLKGRKQECREKFLLFTLVYWLVLKGLFMSLGTCSNEMLGQFVNSAVVFWKTKTKTVAGRLLKHLIFYSTKLILNNLFFPE